jgi:environmental stress-induced protein Ves
MKVHRAAERPSRPWKNGGGQMADVVAFPEGAGLDDFGWRVSTARVESDSDFSLFPGMDRVMALLEGDGLVLEGGLPAPLHLLPGAPPISYPGDVPIRARRLGGDVTALNAIARRGAWKSALRPLPLLPGELALRTEGPAVLLWVSGGGEVGVEGEAASLGLMDAASCDVAADWVLSTREASLAWLATFT